MDRGSSKHGPRLDTEMEREVRGQLQGAGAGGRAEEWHETEPIDIDEPEDLLQLEARRRAPRPIA